MIDSKKVEGGPGSDGATDSTGTTAGDKGVVSAAEPAAVVAGEGWKVKISQ